MPITLTDTHLVILSAAAADANLPVPANSSCGDFKLRTATRSLVTAGYVEIVSVTRDGPVHGTDIDGHPTGLQITPAGLSPLVLARSPATAKRGNPTRAGARIFRSWRGAASVTVLSTCFTRMEAPPWTS